MRSYYINKLQDELIQESFDIDNNYYNNNKNNNNNNNNNNSKILLIKII